MGKIPKNKEDLKMAKKGKGTERNTGKMFIDIPEIQTEKKEKTNKKGEMEMTKNQEKQFNEMLEGIIETIVSEISKVQVNKSKKEDVKKIVSDEMSKKEMKQHKKECNAALFWADSAGVPVTEKHKQKLMNANIESVDGKLKYLYKKVFITKENSEKKNNKIERIIDNKVKTNSKKLYETTQEIMFMK